MDAIMTTMPDFAPGSVWLTGAGPGDPRLLTLLAVSGIQRADVIVHDALVADEVLALARAGADLVHAGKRGGRPSPDQADISNRLVELAQAGHRVLRLKGGDPYVFGRGGEEARQLALHGIPFRVVPGVTAGLGGLTAAGIPATMRGINQAIVLATGHAADSGEALDWVALARLGQPLAIYMALRSIGAIAAAMLAGGIDPALSAAIISGATTAQQSIFVTTLAGLGDAACAADPHLPAIVVIGGIVDVREELRSPAP
jgi:uroporphyrin-III C-methyltransferase